MQKQGHVCVNSQKFPSSSNSRIVFSAKSHFISFLNQIPANQSKKLPQVFLSKKQRKFNEMFWFDPVSISSSLLISPFVFRSFISISSLHTQLYNKLPLISIAAHACPLFEWGEGLDGQWRRWPAAILFLSKNKNNSFGLWTSFSCLRIDFNQWDPIKKIKILTCLFFVHFLTGNLLIFTFFFLPSVFRTMPLVKETESWRDVATSVPKTNSPSLFLWLRSPRSKVIWPDLVRVSHQGEPRRERRRQKNWLTANKSQTLKSIRKNENLSIRVWLSAM